VRSAPPEGVPLCNLRERIVCMLTKSRPHEPVRTQIRIGKRFEQFRTLLPSRNDLSVPFRVESPSASCLPPEAPNEIILLSAREK
jgi:hypothetical protein